MSECFLASAEATMASSSQWVKS